MTSPRNPSGGFWITVALVAVLIYVLSFGPACWVASRANAGEEILPTVHWPMTVAMSQSESVAGLLNWYARLGARGGWSWVEVDPSSWWWIERY